jgi:hypothetical protein
MWWSARWLDNKGHSSQRRRCKARQKPSSQIFLHSRASNRRSINGKIPGYSVFEFRCNTRQEEDRTGRVAGARSENVGDFSFVFFLSLYADDIANSVESRTELEAIANELQASSIDAGLPDMQCTLDTTEGLQKLSLCSSLRTGAQRRMWTHLT